MVRELLKTNIVYGMQMQALQFRREKEIKDEKLGAMNKVKIFLQYFKHGSVQIPHIDLVVSTKCSLRCKYCTQWNPYIKNPKIFSAEYIINSLNKTLEHVDYISRVAVIGGEALLNPELSKILSFCIANAKIGHIILITNGTIYPREDVLDVLKTRKIEVWIDRYMSYSKAAERIVDFCRKYQIDYQDEATPVWYDLGCTLEKKKSEKKEIKLNYEVCWLKNCAAMIEGKLYRCGRTYVLENNQIEYAPHNCIDFWRVTSKAEAKRAIRKLYSLTYLDACAYCNRIDYSKRLIPAEDQVL